MRIAFLLEDENGCSSLFAGCLEKFHRISYSTLMTELFWVDWFGQEGGTTLWGCNLD
jgi:hypothetical protein